jgi:hypothetical protein
VIISLFPSLLVTSPHHSLAMIISSLLFVINDFKLLVICSPHFSFKCSRLPPRPWRSLLESAFSPSNCRQHGILLLLISKARAQCCDQSDPLKILCKRGGVLHSSISIRRTTYAEILSHSHPRVPFFHKNGKPTRCIVLPFFHKNGKSTGSIVPTPWRGSWSCR